MSIQAAQLTDNISRSITQTDRETAAPQGMFMGAKVTQDLNPLSLLADAAEELTFSMSESEESRLDERKEKAGAKEPRPFDPFIEAARKMAQEGGGKFGRALDQLEKLFKSKNNASLAELMDALNRSFSQGEESDPADQFILLAGLRDRLGPESPLTGIIDQALDNLASERTFDVASGLAADSAAADFPELGNNDLRGAYRSVVSDFASPRETLTFLRDRFGWGQINAGLDFLLTVLGNELSSAGPSLEKSQLKALTGDLAVTRVLGGVHSRCAEVLVRLDKAHGFKSAMGSEQLLDTVLASRDNQYVGIQDFQNLVKRVGALDTEREVLFLQDLLQGFRDFPDLFYEGDDGRQRLQGALQNALDDAVVREEEELGL